MKGEYVEGKNETPTNMFSKLHQHQHQHHHQQHQQQQQQQQQQQHQHQHQHLPFSHHFQLSRECQTSEDDDSHSRSTGGATPTITTPGQRPKSTTEHTSTGDGATIEVVRRPRGRPPGSKNKPKPPVFITRDPEPAMSPYILEVPGGADVVEVISRFCRRKNLGLCIFTGSGAVANVTLRQPPSTNPGSTVTFHGRFDILSISATFLPQTASYQIPNVFTISLAGPQGQIVGGAVAGQLIAAGTVYVIAATFSNPTFHRLPIEEEARNSVSGGGEGQSPPGSGGGGGGEGGHVADSCGMSMYNCHLPGNDVIWAPTARPPQPPPPPY